MNRNRHGITYSDGLRHTIYTTRSAGGHRAPMNLKKPRRPKQQSLMEEQRRKGHSAPMERRKPRRPKQQTQRLRAKKKPQRPRLEAAPMQETICRQAARPHSDGLRTLRSVS